MVIRHGYQPMHPPQKEVSHEDMLRILARHASKTKRRLEWDKPVKTGRLSGYMKTLCGGWSISKDACRDEVSYTAWRSPTKTEATVNLGCRLKVEEAKALCEADRR